MKKHERMDVSINEGRKEGLNWKKITNIFLRH